MFQVSCLMWLQTKMRGLFGISKLAIVLACLLVASCGFHLKQASYLPADLKQLTLSGDDRRSALFEQLQADLKRAQVSLQPANPQSAAELYLYNDSLERQTLSLFKNGQVAQYELAYRVRYRLTRPDQAPVEQMFELYRNYQDDPDNALAKAKELELILSEMRHRASQRIIRELSQL